MTALSTTGYATLLVRVQYHQYGWSSHSHKSIVWQQLGYKMKLFSYCRRQGVPCRRCPFTNTGVHWTKLSSTTFGTYRPPLGNSNDVSRPVWPGVCQWRYRRQGGLWRPIDLFLPWSFVGFSFTHRALHRLHLQVTMYTMDPTSDE